VQLEIPGSRLVSFVHSTMRENPKRSPVKPEAIAGRLNAWSQLTFSAVGSSAEGDSIDLARPTTAGKWAEVGDRARRQAVERAQADAVHQVILAISPIVIDANRQLKDAIARPPIADRVTAWLNRQPVTRIEFSDDLKVSLTLTLSPSALGRVLRTAITADAKFARAGGAIDWDRIRTDVEATPTNAVGTATAVVAPATSLPAIVLPITPPDWLDQQLDAEATAHNAGSRLMMGRDAEADATGRIKAQLLALKLDDRTTLGDAARADPQVASAVTRAMRLTHTASVDYLPNGAVHVSMTLDLHDAWDELRGR